MTLKLVERAIYERLKTLAGGKVYVAAAPENAVAPFIVFQRVIGERWKALAGSTGQANANMQIDCYATSYYAAKALAIEVEELLDSYAGNVYYGTGSPQNFVKILGSSLQSESDLIDETDSPLLHRVLSTYQVLYEQN